ncbi:MAG: hypothetical protein D6731_25460 [Planctomycetota bacterium]|nr:MAG: hypothetical protein D6731_25460 [Planctomycetota bacterium]
MPAPRDADALRRSYFRDPDVLALLYALLPLAELPVTVTPPTSFGVPTRLCAPPISLPPRIHL